VHARMCGAACGGMCGTRACVGACTATRAIVRARMHARRRTPASTHPSPSRARSRVLRTRSSPARCRIPGPARAAQSQTGQRGRGCRSHSTCRKRPTQHTHILLHTALADHTRTRKWGSPRSACAPHTHHAPGRDLLGHLPQHLQHLGRQGLGCAARGRLQVAVALQGLRRGRAEGHAGGGWA
jgi:hypothetical protein